MTVTLSVTTKVDYKPFTVPNFIIQDMPAGPKQDGIHELPSIAVADAPQEVLDALSHQFLKDLYAKAGKPCPFHRSGLR